MQEVEAELKRVGHTLRKLDIVLVNTAAGTRYGEVLLPPRPPSLRSFCSGPGRRAVAARASINAPRLGRSTGNQAAGHPLTRM